MSTKFISVTSKICVNQNEKIKQRNVFFCGRKFVCRTCAIYFDEFRPFSFRFITICRVSFFELTKTRPRKSKNKNKLKLKVIFRFRLSRPLNQSLKDAESATIQLEAHSFDIYTCLYVFILFHRFRQISASNAIFDYVFRSSALRSHIVRPCAAT